MNHTVPKEKNIECEDKHDHINVFRFLLGTLVVEIFSEYKGEKVDEYKNFVTIRLLGKTVLTWIYRDKYIRDFYVK